MLSRHLDIITHGREGGGYSFSGLRKILEQEFKPIGRVKRERSMKKKAAVGGTFPLSGDSLHGRSISLQTHRAC